MSFNFSLYWYKIKWKTYKSNNRNLHVSVFISIWEITEKVWAYYKHSQCFMYQKWVDMCNEWILIRLSFWNFLQQILTFFSWVTVRVRGASAFGNPRHECMNVSEDVVLNNLKRWLIKLLFCVCKSNFGYFCLENQQVPLLYSMNVFFMMYCIGKIICN